MKLARAEKELARLFKKQAATFKDTRHEQTSRQNRHPVIKFANDVFPLTTLRTSFDVKHRSFAALKLLVNSFSS
eukprot:2040566-Amphidinium_carterae.1